ncbi:F-box/kelch-repeat protein At3g23880-like [Papaver somniferum]|uniref:F-box/kelch-repeat protein At3g23880-like n=1 Tax=Papaver somniferum TaxID=3469 RepID=UPI000E6F807C|nr:F-box/kelch-repeat protein At3g23880-like [Papaver somniferum]
MEEANKNETREADTALFMNEVVFLNEEKLIPKNYETKNSEEGVCCHYDYDKRIICIWNPSTREYKKIPLFINDGSEKIEDAVYGFGYDGANDDNKSPSLVWRVQESSVEVIMSFNLSNDRIVEIPLPEATLPHPIDRTGEVGANVGLLEGCLCLVYSEDAWKTVDVWVMKDYGAIESWTKQFTIIQYMPRAIWCPVLAFKDGDILANNILESVVCKPKEVGGLRKVNILCNSPNGRCYRRVLESATYVESLVSLNTGTYYGKKILKTQTTSGKKTEKGKRSPGLMKKLITVIIIIEKQFMVLVEKLD